MRILDPSGATVDWLTEQFPDAEIHRVPDETGPYDAAMLYGDLDNRSNPAERLKAICPHVRRPGGRVYVSTREGTKGGMSQRTPGRRRTWRSVDVADLLRRFGTLEEFGVDDDGFISGAITPLAKGREIAIWTGYAIGPWDPSDIVTRGLGGSETAAYRLAETFAEMGYIVTLYGHFKQEGAVKDVILKDFRRFDPTIERRAVIAFRNARAFEGPINADTKILWLEDTAGAEGLTPEYAERWDYICGVSDWHAQNIKDIFPWLDPEKVISSRNGITHSYFEGEAPEREKRLLYTSSPDRGLDIVLECWPAILERVPDATFFHTYGPWYDIVAKVNPKTASHHKRCRELSDAYPSVKAVGPLGQKDLAMLMRSSLVWCAPSFFTPGGVIFHETNCLSGDTLIDMPRNYRTHPDGVPIAELEGLSGFPVWAWDEDAHRFTPRTANKVWKARENAETVRIEFDEDTVLTCTPDHPVLTFDGDWIEAGKLRPGDRLRGLNYRFNVAVNVANHVVRSVTAGPTVDVYDMEVEGLHNFVAGGVVVHNCISVQEAQAAGCLAVSGNWGALVEMNKTGIRIDGDPNSPEWRQKFVDAIVAGLTEPELQKTAQEEGPKAMRLHDWYGVCLQLEKLWDHRHGAEVQDGLVLATA